MSVTVDQVVSENGTSLLSAINDDHGGVIAEMKESMDPNVFHSALTASMLKWRHEGKKGVWLKLPIEHANLIEPAVKEGFWYHHAEPNYLMLVYWIPETPSTIPANASHRVGVGAIVLTDKKEILVVQEKSGKFRGTGIWKIPTGVVDEGEDISAAAVREVKEETGIDTKFVETLAFRQSHKAFFEKSDLFFLCFLVPSSFNIQKQELEIEAAEWLPFEEYAAQPFTQKNGLVRIILDVCKTKMEKGYIGFSPKPVTCYSGENSSYMYLNATDYNQFYSANQY